MAHSKHRRPQPTREQDRLAAETVEAILALQHTFCQRATETEAEWLARLRQQDDELAAEMDRLEVIENNRIG